MNCELDCTLHPEPDADGAAYDPAGAAFAPAAFDTTRYADLLVVARRRLRRYPWLTSVDAAGLVHDCWIRLSSPAAGHVRTRSHYFRLASRVMRQVLFDHMRRHAGEWKHVDTTLDPVDDVLHVPDSGDDVVHAALCDLRRACPSGARIVHLRFYAGYSEEEAAAALGLSLRSVQRYWHLAKRWLADYLEPEASAG